LAAIFGIKPGRLDKLLQFNIGRDDDINRQEIPFTKGIRVLNREKSLNWVKRNKPKKISPLFYPSDQLSFNFLNELHKLIKMIRNERIKARILLVKTPNGEKAYLTKLEPTKLSRKKSQIQKKP